MISGVKADILQETSGFDKERVVSKLSEEALSFYFNILQDLQIFEHDKYWKIFSPFFFLKCAVASCLREIMYRTLENSFPNLFFLNCVFNISVLSLLIKSADNMNLLKLPPCLFNLFLDNNGYYYTMNSKYFAKFAH